MLKNVTKMYKMLHKNVSIDTQIKIVHLYYSTFVL